MKLVKDQHKQIKNKDEISDEKAEEAVKTIMQLI